MKLLGVICHMKLLFIIIIISGFGISGAAVVLDSGVGSTINKPTPSFLQAGCPSCRPTNSVKALKGNYTTLYY